MGNTDDVAKVRSDLLTIARLNEKVKSGNKKNLQIILNYIDEKKPFKSEYGTRYTNRIRNVVQGKPITKKCIMCASPIEDSIALCTKCETAIINGKNSMKKGNSEKKEKDNQEIKENEFANTSAESKSVHSEVSEREKVEVKDLKKIDKNAAPPTENEAKTNTNEKTNVSSKRKLKKWAIVAIVCIVCIGAYGYKKNKDKNELKGTNINSVLQDKQGASDSVSEQKEIKNLINFNQNKVFELFGADTFSTGKTGYGLDNVDKGRSEDPVILMNSSGVYSVEINLERGRNCQVFGFYVGQPLEEMAAHMNNLNARVIKHWKGKDGRNETSVLSIPGYTDIDVCVSIDNGGSGVVNWISMEK